MNKNIVKPIITSTVLIIFYHCTVAQNPPITFAPPKEISLSKAQGISALITADFNKDYLKDVVVFSGKLPGQNIVFEWYRQKEGNEWVRHELDHYGILGKEDTDFIGSAQPCDFDNDGDVDFVFTVEVIKQARSKYIYGKIRDMTNALGKNGLTT